MKYSPFLALSTSVLCSLFASIGFVSAVSVRSAEPIKELTFSGIEYPEGESFKRLKSIIDETFTVQKKKSSFSYSYLGGSSSCISSGWICQNYKYTSLTEKSIKYIILETYEGNEEFYSNLLKSSSYYSSYDYDSYSVTSWSKPKPQLSELLRLVPIGAKVITPVANIFSPRASYSYFGNSNLWSNLISSSFGIDFSENGSQNGMLSAIEQKIKDMKRTKCQKQNQSQSYSYDSTKCPWSGEISNKYLPTLEELSTETIYVNGRSVSIASVKDEFEYKVHLSQKKVSMVPYPQEDSITSLLEKIRDEINALGSDYSQGLSWALSYNEFYLKFYLPILNMRESPSIDVISIAEDTIKNRFQNSAKNNEYYRYYWYQQAFFTQALEEINHYKNLLMTEGDDSTYDLHYLVNNYSLEEAKAELEKKQTQSETVFRGWDSSFWRLPCSTSTSYLVRSECISAQSNMNSIMTALWAYYSDMEKYPDSIDALNSNYLPRQQVLEDFKKNFSYKTVSGSTMYGNDYEITYIGKIGEWSTVTSEKVDYVALLSGATVPKIPDIFLHAPSDSAVLYIENPQNLFALLETKSNTTTRLSGMDVSQSVKEMIQNFFELDDFSTLEKNLQHEALLVIENLDLSAPDITLILSESDRAALSPSAKARVVGSKDGFIYVSNSKSTIDRFLSLGEDKSLSLAPDFRYVWQKKSELIEDAYMFVGDEFFEKMLTFESYITHYRKIRDVERLGKLQELVWSYQDAFGKLPTSFEELLLRVDTDGKLKQFIEAYSIDEWGKVVHKNIGTLGSIKTISEIQYDLSNISRSELDDYKTNVLKYRDIWRASLDPMGIVINRYGDGLEIDFFMTPIPKLEGDFRNVQELFEWVTKDSFEYLKNEKLRMWLFTVVGGFDPKKLEQKAESMKELSESISEANSELLDGKSIFDYIGWEWAFTVWNIPSDILDGWNVEKIDAHIAIEFTSEEKGKEFIDIVRKRFLSEFENSWDGYLDMKTFFAKPLIEDYEWKQIFYVEAIPVPFVGKIGFAYTFVDNFFFLWLNRTTMRHVIDVAKTGDSGKKALIDSWTALKNSFFVSLLDGNTASNDLKWLYEKNRTSIPRYASLLDKNDSGSEWLRQALSSYYIASLRAKRLGIESKPFDFSLGWLSVKELEGEMWVRIDESLQSDLSGTTLQLWENISTDDRFPKDIMSEKGIPVQDFLSNSMKSEILAFELLVQLDRVFEGSESLLRNSTFSLSMGENEIGFVSRVFRQKDGKSGFGGLNNIISWNSWMVYGISWLLILLFLGSGFGYMRYRRWKLASNVFSNPVIPVVAPVSMPISDTVPAGIVLQSSESGVVSNVPPIVAPQAQSIENPIQVPEENSVPQAVIVNEVDSSVILTPVIDPATPVAPIPPLVEWDQNTPTQS